MNHIGIFLTDKKYINLRPCCIGICSHQYKAPCKLFRIPKRIAYDYVLHRGFVNERIGEVALWLQSGPINKIFIFADITYIPKYTVSKFVSCQNCLTALSSFLVHNLFDD